MADPAPALGSEYADLGRQIRAAALLGGRPGAYTARVAVTAVLFLGVCGVVAVLGNTWWQLLAAVGLGVAFTQAAFLGHDGGHQQIFRTRRRNDLFGRLSGNLLVGLSYGWCVSRHNRHHGNPNTEHHDPDIGDGVLAFTTGQLANRTGRLSRALVRNQAWLFFPLLTLEGGNLHIASVRSLLPGGDRNRRGGARRTELALLTAHAVVHLSGLVALVSPVKVLIFVIVQRGGRFVDWWLGGLNYQIEHHLFPSMPRPSRAALSHLHGLGAPLRHCDEVS